MQMACYQYDEQILVLVTIVRLFQWLPRKTCSPYWWWDFVKWHKSIPLGRKSGWERRKREGSDPEVHYKSWRRKNINSRNKKGWGVWSEGGRRGMGWIDKESMGGNDSINRWHRRIIDDTVSRLRQLGCMLRNSIYSEKSSRTSCFGCLSYSTNDPQSITAIDSYLRYYTRENK